MAALNLYRGLRWVSPNLTECWPWHYRWYNFSLVCLLPKTCYVLSVYLSIAKFNIPYTEQYNPDTKGCYSNMDTDWGSTVPSEQSRPGLCFWLEISSQLTSLVTIDAHTHLTHETKHGHHSTCRSLYCFHHSNTTPKASNLGSYVTWL